MQRYSLLVPHDPQGQTSFFFCGQEGHCTGGLYTQSTPVITSDAEGARGGWSLWSPSGSFLDPVLIPARMSLRTTEEVNTTKTKTPKTQPPANPVAPCYMTTGVCSFAICLRSAGRAEGEGEVDSKLLGLNKYRLLLFLRRLMSGYVLCNYPSRALGAILLVVSYPQGYLPMR
ncbi:hypothetical protein LY78DRAFT_494379 [Colletotrichum sublineola]|nr:hypothetical protein LY78DRAFT_494379 [Colletotrichum sublineola]